MTNGPIKRSTSHKIIDAKKAAAADNAHKLKGSTKHNDEMTMIGYKSIKQTREEAWDKKRKKKYENQK